MNFYSIPSIGFLFGLLVHEHLVTGRSRDSSGFVEKTIVIVVVGNDRRAIAGKIFPSAV